MATKKKNLFWIISFVQAVLLSVILFSNGCGGSFVVGSKSSDSGGVSSSSSTAASNPNDIVVIPGAKTASVISANQILDHLTACAGVKNPSDTTLSVYQQKKGAISVYGAANTITSPMMMAVVSVAGEVCNDLISQEKLGPARIFQSMDLQASALPSDGVMGDSIAKLALSCWGRREETGEKQKILDMITSSVGATEAQSGSKAALMMCTSMLSSLDALLN